MRFASLLLALLAIMSAAVSRTEAAALTVSPLHVTLPPDGQPTTVRVENESTSETLVQVSVVEWSEPGEVDAAPEAREVIAVPPIFKLGPDREQVIRLALRGPLAGPWQGRYRLLITEVRHVQPTIDDGNEGIGFQRRHRSTP